MPTPPQDRRLERLSRLCLALPGVVCRRRGSHADFRVRERVFAYYLDNHHGDGIVAVCCKTALGENEDRVRREPDRFYLPAYIGKRGWFGLRLDQGRIDWREIENLIALSYRLIAPRRELQRLDANAAARDPARASRAEASAHPPATKSAAGRR